MDFLGIVVPIFGLIFLGGLLKAVGLFPPWLVNLLNGYVYYVGMAVITFLSLQETSTSLLFDWRIYLLSLLPIAVIVVISYFAARALKMGKAVVPVVITCAFFGNTAYIGFPLNISVQGQNSLSTAAFISTIYTVIVFTFGAYLCQRYSEKGGRKGLQLHRIPVFWAVAAGLLLSVIVLPGIIRVPLEFIQTSTSPLALLATGAMISAAGIREHLKEIGTISVLKLLVMPAVVVIAAAVSGISGTIYKTSLLEAAVPVGVTNTTLARQFGLDDRLASSVVVASTALFIVSLSLILLIL